MIRFSHEANSWMINRSGRGFYWEPITPELARMYAATYRVVIL
jgi:hypothetical protein